MRAPFSVFKGPLRKNMENHETSPLEITRDNCHLYRIDFGKYSGRTLLEIPTDYLRWLRSELRCGDLTGGRKETLSAVSWYLWRLFTPKAQFVSDKQRRLMASLESGGAVPEGDPV